MRKVYLVKQYKWGEPIFATDTKVDADHLAATIGVSDDDLAECVIEVTYIQSEKGR